MDVISYLCDKLSEYQKLYNRAFKQEEQARKLLGDEPDREDVESDLNYAIRLQDRCVTLMEFISELLREMRE